MKYKKEKINLILNQAGIVDDYVQDFLESLESLKEEEFEILTNFFESDSAMAVKMFENFKLKKMAIEKSDFDDLKKIILSEEEFLAQF